jgi:hypothetical protein
MVNKNKAKGTRWENEACDILNEKIQGAHFKRVVGSGAIGTTMGEPTLTGDIKGEIEHTHLKFKGEAKARTGATQLALKKEWIDKIIMEAKQTFSIPILFCKFIGARSGVRSFVALDIDTFCDLINLYIDTKKELDKVLNG